VRLGVEPGGGQRRLRWSCGDRHGVSARGTQKAAPGRGDPGWVEGLSSQLPCGRGASTPYTSFCFAVLYCYPLSQDLPPLGDSHDLEIVLPRFSLEPECSESSAQLSKSDQAWTTRLSGLQLEQVIHQEGVRVNQAAATAGSNVLIQAMLKQLGLTLARHAYDVEVGGAG